MASGERWSYHAYMMNIHGKSMVYLPLNLVHKSIILIMCLIDYFFVTSVTALVVRVLTSSGVMLLVPFFHLCRYLGMYVDERILDYAHPWLGMTRRQIQRRGLHPNSHFVGAHLCKLIL
eukprot:333048_1